MRSLALISLMLATLFAHQQGRLCAGDELRAPNHPNIDVIGACFIEQDR